MRKAGFYHQDPPPGYEAEGEALAIIPARGGSVRIPRKNIKPFHGSPIITYSISTAKVSGLFKRIIVSTDDLEIAKMAEQWGVEVRWRPLHLIEPDPGTQAIAADLLETLRDEAFLPRFACVIYATSPLMRRTDLLRGYIEVAKGMRFAMAVGAEPLRDAGQFYWGWSSAFLNQQPLIHPQTAMIPVPEGHVCDINVQEDWDRAERLYAEACEKDRTW